MKFTRKASASWQGTGLEGTGHVSTGSKVLDNAPLTHKSRFKDQPGANPEELVGAAHAGCFCMKLSFVIGGMGFTADNLSAKATVTFENDMIAAVHLDVEGKVPGMTAEQFAEATKDAKENCPISRSLRADITMNATLVD